eukprot:7326242-Prymnesium_polylepis.1
MSAWQRIPAQVSSHSENWGEVSLGPEVTEYPGPSGETSAGRDGWVRSAHLKCQEAVASLRKAPSM